MAKQPTPQMMLNRLNALVIAIENYIPGAAGTGRTLQDALKSVVVPVGLKFEAAAQWAKAQIALVERTMASDALIATAKARVKTADASLVLAQREVNRARKDLELCEA